MIFRPGQTLILGAIAMAAFAGFAFVMPYGFELSAGLGVLLLGASVVEGWFLRREMDRMDVRRNAPAIAARGRAFPVALEVSNGSGRACMSMLRDLVPMAANPSVLSAEQRLEPGATPVVYKLTVPVRGLHEFGDTWLRISGRMGLLEIQKSFPTSQSIRVLPESLVPDEELSKDALDERRLLDQVRETRQRGEGTEFESLSEYREGDDVRRIDWRSSARMSRLIIRRYQLEQHRDVVVLIDAGRLMGTAVNGGTKLDCAVDSGLIIARVALETGDRCGLGVFDSKVKGYLSPVAGVASHRILIDRLYNVQPAWVETNFAPMFATLQSRQRKRALLVILSDIMELETTERYRAALLSLKQRHEVLFAALRTPLLRHAADAMVDEAKDAARKAFALRLMREREQTLHVLRRSGVHVLDVEPQQLTIPLLNSFIELRQRSVM